MNGESDKKYEILVNILFCVLVSVLSIIDHLNALEYYIYAEYHSHFFKVCCLIFLVIHPIVLFLYQVISLLYMAYISDHDFSELTQEEEYFEMIYFREKVRSSLIWVTPLAIYLTILTYFKFFSFYSIKFLLESPRSMSIFRNVITTTLYHSVIIQSLFQSLPQIVLQVTNNLLLFEDKHDMRGVFNFSTFFSLAFIGMIVVLYFRDKPANNNSNNDSDRTRARMTSLNANSNTSYNNKIIL